MDVQRIINIFRSVDDKEPSELKFDQIDVTQLLADSKYVDIVSADLMGKCNLSKEDLTLTSIPKIYDDREVVALGVADSMWLEVENDIVDPKPVKAVSKFVNSKLCTRCSYNKPCACIVASTIFNILHGTSLIIEGIGARNSILTRTHALLLMNGYKTVIFDGVVFSSLRHAYNFAFRYSCDCQLKNDEFCNTCRNNINEASNKKKSHDSQSDDELVYIIIPELTDIVNNRQDEFVLWQMLNEDRIRILTLYNNMHQSDAVLLPWLPPMSLIPVYTPVLVDEPQSYLNGIRRFSCSVTFSQEDIKAGLKSGKNGINKFLQMQDNSDSTSSTVRSQSDEFDEFDEFDKLVSVLQCVDRQTIEVARTIAKLTKDPSKKVSFDFIASKVKMLGMSATELETRLKELVNHMVVQRFNSNYESFFTMQAIDEACDMINEEE